MESPRVTEFRLILYVYHFDAVDHFYRDILGFPVKHSWFTDERNHGVMFDTGCGIIELLGSERFQEQAVDCKVALQVPNVVELRERVAKTGYAVTPLTKRPWGDIDFTVVDPEGFPLIFFSSPPFDFTIPEPTEPGLWKRQTAKL